MTEQGKYEVYTKKLQGICDEHNLVYSFKKDGYPIMLIITTAGGVGQQMDMLANAEEDGYRSPDAKLIFSFKDGDLEHRTVGTFTIGDELFSKLKNLFKNMHYLWLQYFQKEVVQNGLLTAEKLPHIEDPDGSDIVSETFDEVRDEMQDLEEIDDEEDGDGYDYEEPGAEPGDDDAADEP